MKHFFKILLIIFISANLFASDTKMYMLPKQAKPALKQVLKELGKAKKSVKITIYNFTHKKIAKRLKYIAKKGIKVKIIYDFESTVQKRNKSTIYYLSKYKNIETFRIKGKFAKRKKYYGKMHQKIALIDDKVLILGSANWSYSGFGKNYEVVLILKDKDLAKKYSKFFDSLEKKATKF